MDNFITVVEYSNSSFEYGNFTIKDNNKQYPPNKSCIQEGLKYVLNNDDTSDNESN